jgi:peroxiredoxin Q/BCP
MAASIGGRPMTWLAIAVVLIVGFVIWRNIAVAAVVPKAGDAAPEFSLPDQDGKTRTLADFRDKWLALYFFPRADTPG